MTEDIKCCWCSEVIVGSADKYYKDGIALHPECELEADAGMKMGEVT